MSFAADSRRGEVVAVTMVASSAMAAARALRVRKFAAVAEAIAAISGITTRGVSVSTDAGSVPSEVRTIWRSGSSRSFIRRLREPSALPVAIARASRKYHDDVVATRLVVSGLALGKAAGRGFRTGADRRRRSCSASDVGVAVSCFL